MYAPLFCYAITNTDSNISRAETAAYSYQLRLLVRHEHPVSEFPPFPLFFPPSPVSSFVCVFIRGRTVMVLSCKGITQTWLHSIRYQIRCDVQSIPAVIS